MACTYRTKDRNGKKHAVWRFKFRDHTGKWRYGTGWPDRKRTREHALTLEAECRAIRKGEKEARPSWLRARNKPIQEVIDDFLSWGRTQGGRGGRPWDDQHGAQKRRALKWWVKELGLTILADIDLGRVEKAAQRLLVSRSPKTVQGKVEALRSLCLWAVKRGLLSSNPLAGLGRFNTKPKTPHRALSDKELAALLRVAPPNRQLWYEVALATGYRVSELRALRVKNLDLFMPSLPLGADYTKNRKDARQPITRGLANKLAALAKGKPGDAPLLDIPKREAWRPFSKDCEVARIRQITDEGRASWHSLRKCYVNALVRSGADLKTVMELARHSTAAMSMEVYASPDPTRLQAAAEAAAQHVEDAVSRAACCTDVARAAVGAEGGAVSHAPTTDSDVIGVVSAAGSSPVSPTPWQDHKALRGLVL